MYTPGVGVPTCQLKSSLSTCLCIMLIMYVLYSSQKLLEQMTLWRGLTIAKSPDTFLWVFFSL